MKKIFCDSCEKHITIEEYNFFNQTINSSDKNLELHIEQKSTKKLPYSYDTVTLCQKCLIELLKNICTVEDIFNRSIAEVYNKSNMKNIRINPMITAHIALSDIENNKQMS